MSRKIENFNANAAKEATVEWIKNYFLENGPDCKAVVGISGGKDSSVVAALCVEALGKENVLAVKMPEHIQRDINYADMLIKHLDLPKESVFEINIGDITTKIYDALEVCDDISLERHLQITTNTPARVRMTILYAIAAGYHGRVANTCNYSEDYVGYSTKFGDNAGDFAPLHYFTATEVKQIGYALGLPKELIEKPPEDGLSGKTDEENFGFTYEELDNFLRCGTAPYKILCKIDKLHNNNLHKMRHMPTPPPFTGNYRTF